MQPEPECLRGALGEIGQGGVPVEGDPVRRERSLRRALSEYVEHFHAERKHQRKGNALLFPRDTDRGREGPVRCREK